MRHSAGVYIDPFNCRLLTRQQAVGLIIDVIGPQLATADYTDQQMLYKELEEQYLTAPASLKTIFQRMLNNILSYSKRSPTLGAAGEEHMVSLLSLSILFDETNYKERLSKLEMLVSVGDVESVAEEVDYIKKHFREITEFYNANALTRFIAQIERVSEEIAKQYQDVDPTKKPLSKHRTNEIKYRVGDVMRHKRYGYRGVIFGYDPHCALSSEWQRQMRVAELPNGATQPFYNVLVTNDRERHNQTTYVAQENIQLLGVDDGDDQGLELNHDEIGRYFESFDREQYRYLPNEYTRHLYPE
jgi:hemimethylated DNA binding protein